MYQRFYGLSQKPFHTTPDPDFLYLSPSHKQALGTILCGIEQRNGFIAVLGEVGLGKTTILRAVLAQVDESHNRIVYLLNPNLSFTSFLQTLLRELDQPQESQDEAELIAHIHHVLIDEYEKGKTVVLFIDEAQQMPVPTLEGLRLLSNLETEKDKLIQIVLVGQPELRHILEQHELRQLEQRIAIRATILPLTARESQHYIWHRLERAGGKGSRIFSKGALGMIIRHAKGNPRQINRLCDNALVTGLGYHTSPVTAKIVKEVIADLQGTRPTVSWTWIPVAASLVFAFLAGGWMMMAKPIGSLDGFSFMKANAFISHEVKKESILPIAKEATESMDDRGALVMESQEVLSSQESRADKMVPVEPKSSQAKDAETSLARNRVMATKVVREGDTLEKLLREVYGISGPKTVQLVLSHNPHLKSAKKIFPDQVVVFPALGTGSSNGKMQNVVLRKSNNLVDNPQELVGSSREIFTQSSSRSEDHRKASRSFSAKIQAVATVQDGDTLERLARDVYGISKPLYIKKILQANPHIQDSNHLFPGQTVRFPDIAVHEK